MKAFVASAVVAGAVLTGFFATAQADAQTVKPVQTVAVVTVTSSTSAVGVLCH